MTSNTQSAASNDKLEPTRYAPVRRAGTGAAAGSPAHDCAIRVLEVVPAVMDSVRGAMRMHVGEQLSIPQYRCLNFIARTPGCSIGSAAAFLGVTMPTASAMVDRLVRAGAVATRADITDRRRARLTLTDAGRIQLRAVRRGARGEVARALSACSTDELQVLHEALAVLSRVFQSESNRA